MIRRARGFGAADTLPQEFWTQADNLLEMMRNSVEAYRNAGWMGADTLTGLVAAKARSLSDVRSGALSPAKWLAGAEELLTNIQDSISYMNRTSSTWVNVSASLMDASKTLETLKRIVAAIPGAVWDATVKQPLDEAAEAARKAAQTFLIDSAITLVGGLLLLKWWLK